MGFSDALRRNKKPPTIAVIDVETTGLNPYGHDRIVELAVLVMRLDGRVLREFVTLINPERDIGPTHIHGLTTQDVLAAPRFSEIVGALFEALEGCVALAGHNIGFDRSFLDAECDRLKFEFPDVHTLCTMRLAGGGRLTDACNAYGIPFEEAEVHSALYDTRAAARLLTVLINRDPRLTRAISSYLPITWPHAPKSSTKILTRDTALQHETEPLDYLQQLLTRVQPVQTADNQNTAIPEYVALLDRALENRQISIDQGQGLIELATRRGVNADQIRVIHRDYLTRLVTAALADGIVTEAERRDLQRVAWLLGINTLDEIIELVTQELAAKETRPPETAGTLTPDEFAGKRVCFTGVSLCRLNGETITRAIAAEIATMHGMTVTDSVTKKLDLLVVADPLTQSGKAKRASQYKIRVIHELVFWRALGLEVN